MTEVSLESRKCDVIDCDRSQSHLISELNYGSEMCQTRVQARVVLTIYYAGLPGRIRQALLEQRAVLR